MAIPPKDMQEDSSSKPVLFSYAQAAKGKSLTPVDPSKSMPQEKESISWADDAADDETVIEEHHQNGEIVNGTVSSETSGHTVTTESQADTADTNLTPSNVDSPTYESSATTVKNDDLSSPSRSATGSAWDVGSRGEGSEGVKPDTEDTSQQGDKEEGSRKGSTDDTSTKFKEARPPLVNFWTKRAEEQSKGKPSLANATSRSLPNAAFMSALGSLPAQSNMSIDTKSQQATQARNGGSQTQPKEVALPRQNKSRLPGPSRPQVHGVADVKSVPPPPSGDPTAWPTPLTAQDTDRRKEQEKEDKPEPERSTNTSSSAQGKGAWQKMDLSHSVYQPFAPERRRGPPTHVRGAHEGSRRGGRGSFAGAPGTERPEHDSRSAATSTRKPSIQSRPQPNEFATEPPRDARVTSHANLRQPTNATSAKTSIEDDKQSYSSKPPPRDQDRASLAKTDTITNATTQQSPGLTSEERASQESSWDRSTPTQINTEPERRFSEDRRKQAQSESVRGGHDTTPRRGKKTPPESRSRAHSQGFETSPFGMSGSYRGRGGRGRGRGRGDFAGSSHGHHFAPPSLPAIQTNGPGSSKAATAFASPFSSSPGHERRGYRNVGQRASVSNDVSYGRQSVGTTPMSPYGMHPAQGYEYGMPPMSAFPYAPYMEQFIVSHGIGTQLSYYFSLENMLKDLFLRSYMDSKGFVPLRLIANFKRIKDLTTDFDLIKGVCYEVHDLEMRTFQDGQVLVRRREGWDKWVLPMDQRDPSAQHDGPPEQAQAPPPIFQPQNVHRPAMNGSASTGQASSQLRAQEASTFTPMTAGIPQDAAGPRHELSNGTAMPQINSEAKPIGTQQKYVNGIDKAQGSAEAEFPDSQIPTLMVAVKRLGDQQTPHPRQLSTSSRTFSHGSLQDGIPGDANTRSRSAMANRDAQADSAMRAFNAAKSPSRPAKSHLELYWLKGNDTEASELPSNGDSEPYLQVHAQATEARLTEGSGECPYELQVLYQFWSHFLIRHFNKTMYDEFRRLARDDVERGLSDTGIKHLLSYYHEAVANPRIMHDRVARHYVHLVQAEDRSKPSRPAFDQLRRAWLNGATNVRNRKKISDHLDADLRAELDR